MVDYVPLSRRRRNAILAVLATLLLGLGVGVAVGRSAAITASEAAQEVRVKADTLGTRLEALTIEYDQAISGAGDTIQSGVLDALDIVEADIDKLIAQSPWLGVAQEQALQDATNAVRVAGENRVTADDFAEVAAKAAVIVRQTFGARE